MKAVNVSRFCANKGSYQPLHGMTGNVAANSVESVVPVQLLSFGDESTYLSHPGFAKNSPPSQTYLISMHYLEIHWMGSHKKEVPSWMGSRVL